MQIITGNPMVLYVLLYVVNIFKLYLEFEYFTSSILSSLFCHNFEKRVNKLKFGMSIEDWFYYNIYSVFFSKFWKKNWLLQHQNPWLPDLCPDLKIDRNLSVIIFDALSIAVYRVSLRGPGAELEGGRENAPPPPAQHGKHRPIMPCYQATTSAARVKGASYGAALCASLSKNVEIGKIWPLTSGDMTFDLT